MADGTNAITTVHFVVMAIFAALAVIAIVTGMRLKRGRVQARREVEEHAIEAGVEPEPIQEQQPAPSPASPPPLAPSPPPLATEPVPATPAPVPGDMAGEAIETPGERPLADEPIAAIAPDGTTAAVAVDAAAINEVPDAPSPADGPLTDIKGLGPRVAGRLGELGIQRVGQLAALDAREAEALDAELGPFTGRMARDRWLEQARLLAAGDRDGFERAFGKL